MQDALRGRYSPGDSGVRRVDAALQIGRTARGWGRDRQRDWGSAREVAAWKPLPRCSGLRMWEAVSARGGSALGMTTRRPSGQPVTGRNSMALGATVHSPAAGGTVDAPGGAAPASFLRLL